MADLPDYTMQVYFCGDRLPPEAVELFGNDVEAAWAQGATAADGPSQGRAMPAIIAATADGHWMAGVFMLMEFDAPVPGRSPAGAGEALQQRVASIRHLIVPPAVRGRGLAGRLLRRAMSVANQAGCARVRSTAGWGCPDHLAIYDRLGFDQADGADRPYLVTRDVADHA